MFETDWVDRFQGLIDDMQPKYKCIKDYKGIHVGDIVNVEIKVSTLHKSICITHNRHAYFINSHTLDTYFEKENKFLVYQ